MKFSQRTLSVITIAVLALCSSTSVFSQADPVDLALVSRPHYVYANQSFELSFLVADILDGPVRTSSYLVDGFNIGVFYDRDPITDTLNPSPPPSNTLVSQRISGLKPGDYTVYVISTVRGEDLVGFDFSEFHRQPRGVITILPGNLELEIGLGSPKANELVSGFGIIRGWACYLENFDMISASVGILGYQIDNGRINPIPYGSSRIDAAERCNGRANTGFAAAINWNRFSLGSHTFTLYVDGQEAISHDVIVSGTGERYLSGLEAEYELNDFPSAGDTTIVGWSQSAQDFTIIGVENQ